MNAKEQHLEIIIKDHRPDGRRGTDPDGSPRAQGMTDHPRVRRRQYTKHKPYLRDMQRLGGLHGVRLRETTRTVVEIWPASEKELFGE